MDNSIEIVESCKKMNMKPNIDTIVEKKYIYESTCLNDDIINLSYGQPQILPAPINTLVTHNSFVVRNSIYYKPPTNYYFYKCTE